MAAPYHFAKRKTEDALEGLITQNRGLELQGLPFFKGMSGTALTTDAIHIVAEQAEPELFGEGPIGGHYTGNMLVEVKVMVVSHTAGIDRATHGRRCAAVEDILMSTEIINQINNNPVSGVDDYQAFAWRPGPSEDEADDEYLTTSYEGIMYCAPSIPEE